MISRQGEYDLEPGCFDPDPSTVQVGCKVKFKKETRSYTVQASNDRFAICTKPFSLKRTVLYCIIDYRRKVRGPENLVFGMGAETREECEQMLARLMANETEVSHRHDLRLDVEKVTAKCSI